MGKKTQVSLGTEFFERKMDVEARVREMIKNYPIMGAISGADQLLCLELFKHHPEANLKFGSGISSIQVRLDKYGKRYFHLHRTDGSDDDISWPKCLTNIK
jgi:hypothetical protein